MQVDKNTTKTSIRLRRLLLASIWCLPMWVYLFYDIQLWRQGRELMPPFLHFPGALISLLIEPTWHGMHDYSLTAQSFFNSLFYLAVAYVILSIRAHRQKSKGKVDPSS
jgi:hypothetical protein